jgi:hypothetical protein
VRERHAREAAAARDALLVRWAEASSPQGRGAHVQAA